MDALVPAFEESLLCPLTDITLDIGELGIDSFMESGVVQQIPILKTIYSVAQVAQNIYDRNLMRQTAQFLMEFNENRISEEKLNKYKNKLSQNPSRREEELSRVLVLLNKNIDLKKSQLEARFFAAYVDEKLTWDEFCELCDITDRLFINDLLLLKKASDHGGVIDGMELSYQHERLISLGLLTNEARLSGSIIMSNLDSSEPEKLLNISKIGEKFCRYAFQEPSLSNE